MLDCFRYEINKPKESQFEFIRFFWEK